MIELSKCPNCASEDKVTIAGKDFCMRCGTPSPDASQPTDTSSPQTTDSTNVVPQADQNPAPVSKFTDPVPAAGSQPVTDQPAMVAPQAATAPVQPLNQPAQPPSVPDVTVAQPPVSNMAQVQPPTIESPVVATADQVVQNPIPVTTTATVGQNYPSNPVAQAAAGNMPIVTQPTPTTNPIPTPLPPAVPTQPTATPDPIQMSADQPLTQPAASPTPEPQPEEVSEPRIHTHQAIMNLDKKDSGVFSDEQLDELSKISDQGDQLTASSDQPKTIMTNSNPTSSTTFHTDIQPPNQTVPKPAPETPSAVSKVADNDIKIPDKDNKGKKVLKPAGIALSIVALFLVGAYIWQVNYPTLAFKIASAKAGMSASMPGYMPGGYKLAGEIQTNPGSVSYNLVNGGQNKKISISQTKTDWDSQALAENYVAPKAENYLALQGQGLTIYMVGDSQATWVNKGTWYKIESPDQSLSQDQAIKIATSL